MEGLTAACTIQVCLSGQNSISVGIAVSQQEKKKSREEMWDSKWPWHRGTWGADSDAPAVHGAPMWARPRPRHVMGTARLWHRMEIAWPRHSHSTPVAQHGHGRGTTWPGTGHSTATAEARHGIAPAWHCRDVAHGTATARHSHGTAQSWHSNGMA